MKIIKTEFNKTGWDLYTMTNIKGSSVSVTNYGAALVSVCVPDRNGVIRDVVLGYDSADDYEKDPYYFGAIVGRTANRTDKGRFSIGGKEYQLATDEAGNCNLHSAPDGYDKRTWEGEILDFGVRFSLHSPDGDQGFPGDFDVNVTYLWTDENELIIEYNGISNQDTLVNMTNHVYFNLNGEGTEDVMNHEVQIKASFITASDEHSVVKGELMHVEGTPFDFRASKLLGKDAGIPHIQLERAGGYDHNFAIDGEGFRQFAVVSSPLTGIGLEVLSDLPGMQMYAGNFLGSDGHHPGKGGHIYGTYAGVALETQYYPNAINIPHFKQPILKSGERYNTKTCYRFFVK